MDCLVECEQLGSAGSARCNTFSGRQQTRARERVLNRTLHTSIATLQDTLQGGYTFSFQVSWGPSALGTDETEDGWPRGGFTAHNAQWSMQAQKSFF